MMESAMSRHRIAFALAAVAALAACERSGQAPATRSETLATLPASDRQGPLRVTDSGLAVDALGPAAGDGLRPAPGPTGLRP
jgi:hypothetical protein